MSPVNELLALVALAIGLLYLVLLLSIQLAYVARRLWRNMRYSI